MIGELAADGTAVMFSSHQLDLVEHVCQDVVVIDHGRVVLQGELERLRAASSRRYLGRVPRGRAAGRRRSSTPACSRPSPAAPGSSSATASTWRRSSKLARSAGDVTRFSLEPPALSDLFHEAVGR